MTWWQALVLGVVQGLGEFLPISSSGHLVLFQNIFGIKGEVLLFDTLLHAGTLAAVFVALWPDIWALLKKPWQKTTGLLVIATIPAVVVALLWKDQIEATFGGAILGWEFLLTAVILLATGLISSRRRTVSLEKMTVAQSIFMGVAQAVAILPGVSRSGTTIAAGLGSRVERDAAVRFSFLMSIPAVLGSLIFQAKDMLEINNPAVAAAGMSWGAIALGVIAAMVTGYIALRWMLRLVKNGRLWVFGLYTGVLGILVLCDQIWLHLVF